ncbi:MAG: phage major capsid protein [Rhizobiales bacterium]|nr:phage major capsid protein [Hyphomicrobiales bacterium]
MATMEDVLRTIGEQHKAVVALHEKNAASTGEIGTRLRDVEQKLARRGGAGGAPAPNSWGKAVIESDGYKNFVGAMGHHGTVKISLPQAALTSVPDSGGALVAPDRQAEIVGLPRQRLVVRSLLAPGRTGSNLIQFVRQTGFTNNAGVVSEGVQKPESSISYDLVDAPVRTIAHWVPVSRQVMDDAPQLQSSIDSDLRYGLALNEELELLLGDGTGEHILGLIPQATAYSAPFVVTGEQRLDTLLLAIAQAEQAKLPATGIIVNNLDWRKMQLLKDDQGRYIGSGPFSIAASAAWSIPVVPSLSMPQGDFLVGAFGIAAQVFDRLDAEVLVSSEDRDNFIKNMLTVRAEERLAMAVKRPEALIYGQYTTED